MTDKVKKKYYVFSNQVKEQTTYDKNGRIVETITYDKKGNEIGKLSYEYYNNNTKKVKSVTNHYDKHITHRNKDGLLKEENCETITEYDKNGKPINEIKTIWHNSSNNVKPLKKEIVTYFDHENKDIFGKKGKKKNVSVMRYTYGDSSYIKQKVKVVTFDPIFKNKKMKEEEYIKYKNEKVEYKESDYTISHSIAKYNDKKVRLNRTKTIMTNIIKNGNNININLKNNYKESFEHDKKTSVITKKVDTYDSYNIDCMQEETKNNETLTAKKVLIKKDNKETKTVCNNINDITSEIKEGKVIIDSSKQEEQYYDKEIIKTTLNEQEKVIAEINNDFEKIFKNKKDELSKL